VIVVYAAALVYLLIGIRIAAHHTLDGLRKNEPLPTWHTGLITLLWLPGLVTVIVLVPFTYVTHLLFREK
jgi:hypothetical protein